MKGLANRMKWGVPILIISVGLLSADLYGWLDGYGLWILSLTFGAGAIFEAISFPPLPGGSLRARQLSWILVYAMVVTYLVQRCTSFFGDAVTSVEVSSSLLGAVLLLSTLVSTTLGFASNRSKGKLWTRVYSLLTVLWLSIPISCTLLLASLEGMETSGIHLVLCTVLMVKGSDTGAYFVGRNFGRRPLHPISPKKTIEGLLAGIASAAAIGYLYAEQLADPGFTPGMALFIGVLVAVVGQISDLQESALKRRVGRKDSGETIPGLGGALDMIDSLILVMPMVLWLRIVLDQ
ncbi:MAG: phosphatidate cytidylyltransferase [Planctomycetes bacterium]|jgi:CDP-diglyceride synthetase|nr:phosphatidate cytidylyltransferase [Planctomycetota bacterium]MBT6451806.1 phosphatidate cytidylyltransferase [Planctomycetota bacterium]MBT6541544.1 phosphatidate cytidylyltransferase [Planctomycetota bacterium]MBT6784629.1 phosphatidate cytidylyltransferase [Planctomycetota bacterium]MBT6969138.1 phosphatidate cytidylyltransferase [Planctomycetota bacterium]